MTATAAKIHSVAEYLRIEQETGERHSFYNGTLKKMAGGTIAHNRITRNVFGLLFNQLADRPNFEIFGSDQKIYLPKYHFYVYPDVVVIAGQPIETDEEVEAITNPILIIETLSSSTEKYDRRQKFIEYQSLPSLQEYVMLRQDAAEALLFFREAPDVWRSSEVAGSDQDLWFRSIETGLKMAAVYDRVTF